MRTAEELLFYTSAAGQAALEAQMAELGIDLPSSPYSPALRASYTFQLALTNNITIPSNWSRIYSQSQRLTPYSYAIACWALGPQPVVLDLNGAVNLFQLTPSYPGVQLVPRYA